MVCIFIVFDLDLLKGMTFDVSCYEVHSLDFFGGKQLNLITLKPLYIDRNQLQVQNIVFYETGSVKKLLTYFGVFFRRYPKI